MALYRGSIAAPGTPKTTSTPSFSITFTTASITSIRATAKPAFPDPRPAVASAYLVPRLIFDDPQQHRVVLAAPALPPHDQEHLVDDGRYRQRYAVFPPGPQRYAEVPAAPLRAETGLEGG